MFEKSSKRGGASASASCKSNLGKCMTSVVQGGGSLRKAGKSCMAQFNSCRTGGRKARKVTRKSVRKGRKGRR